MNENKIGGLAIWNAILSVLVFMLAVALWQTQEDLKLERELSQMGHESQHKSLLIVSEAVGLNSSSIGNNADSIALLADIFQDHQEWGATAIAEIYQGHIIPIRAILMNNDLNSP